MVMEELASHVRPAKCETDRLVGPIPDQALEAIVAIDLQDAFEARQMFSWPQVLAVVTIDVGNHGM